MPNDCDVLRTEIVFAAQVLAAQVFEPFWLKAQVFAAQVFAAGPCPRPCGRP